MLKIVIHFVILLKLRLKQIKSRNNDIKVYHRLPNVIIRSKVECFSVHYLRFSTIHICNHDIHSKAIYFCS